MWLPRETGGVAETDSKTARIQPGLPCGLLVSHQVVPQPKTATQGSAWGVHPGSVVWPLLGAASLITFLTQSHALRAFLREASRLVAKLH